jgi:hypothetical protein
MAHHVLHSRDNHYKLKLNTQFTNRLHNTLQRPESYDYPFDSLKTVSRLFPEDNSFRIFTWQTVEMDEHNTFRQHTYYGLVQRKFKGNIVLIPLIDKVDYFLTVENVELSNENWLGALYYKPRNSDYGVLTYKGEVGRYNAKKKKVIREKVSYYVLLGFNGHDIGSNYKMVEVLRFDEEDSAKVHFGTPIFNFNDIGKYRVVFKYSDNSPFNLNQDWVVTPPFKKKRKMLVFDHLVEPKHSELNLYGVGADGTQDALYWLNRVNGPRKGFFVFVRNVDVYIPEMEKYDPKVVEKQAQRAAEGMQALPQNAPKQKKK